ncbi:ATP-binding cassette sub-family C member 4-like [Diadema antillarum]|uniref:ATP-binding cassette sub-family C member 4-like n=1 Tax=Diadema antillarum TaxID=105358 RepID=UPI003A85C0A9
MEDGPPNPVAADRSCLAQMFFCWLLPLFKYGYKNTLEMPQLHRVCPSDSAEALADSLERNWRTELQSAECRHKKPSLLRALAKTFWRPLAFSGMIVFAEECIFKLLQPILLSILVTYFSPDPGITTLQAYLCAFGMAVCGACATIMHHPYFFNMQRLGMQIRIATSTLIFRKSLRLSNAALGQTTTGKLVNILSNDVNRFDLVMLFIHYLWIGPMQLVVLLIILYRSMGPSCLVGFTILIALAPLQGWMGKIFSKLRGKTALLTDERVRIMNEIISGMRIIKIHAWENPFSELVKKSRRKEIIKILSSTCLRAFNLAFFSMAAVIISFATFTVYAFTGHVLQPSIVFLAIPLFNAVRLTVVLFIPYCIMYCSEGLISIKRIQGFLVMDELKTLKRSPSVSSISSDANLPVAEQIGEPLEEDEMEEKKKEQREKGVEETKMENHNHVDVEVGFRSGADEDREQLKHLVDGHVGSKEEGKGNREEKEDAVDPEDLDGGLKMEVAEEGVTLCLPSPLCQEDEEREVFVKNLQGSWEMESQGEGSFFSLKHISFRVKPGELVAVIGPVGAGKSTLLMALMNELPKQTGEVIYHGKLGYTAQQPWVFSGTLRDNILFGKKFDADKYKRVLTACALKTDLSLLPDSDLTLVGDRGITLSGGQRARVSLARAVYHDADFYLLDDPLSAVDSAVGRHLFDKCIKEYLKKKPVILVTHQLQYLDAADRIIVLKEGCMVGCGSYKELQTSGVDFAALLKEYKNEEEQETLSRTSSLHSIAGSVVSEISAFPGDDITLQVDDQGSQRLKETKEEGSVSSHVYFSFFRAGAGIFGFLIFTVFNIASQAFFTLTDWWISQWAFAEEEACGKLLNSSCSVNTVVGAIFIYSLAQYTPLKYEGDYVYPDWGYVLGWTLALMPMINIPLFFVYTLVFCGEGSLKQRWVALTTSNIPEFYFDDEEGDMEKKNIGYTAVEMR